MGTKEEAVLTRTQSTPVLSRRDLVVRLKSENYSLAEQLQQARSRTEEYQEILRDVTENHNEIQPHVSRAERMQKQVQVNIFNAAWLIPRR